MGRWPQYAVAVVLAMKVLADKDRIVSLPAYTFLELPQASGRVWDFVYFLATSRAAKLRSLQHGFCAWLLVSTRLLQRLPFFLLCSKMLLA